MGSGRIINNNQVLVLDNWEKTVAVNPWGGRCEGSKKG